MAVCVSILGVQADAVAFGVGGVGEASHVAGQAHFRRRDAAAGLLGPRQHGVERAAGVAERLYKRAIELSPNYGAAHHRYATYLAEMGRTHEAVAEARRGTEVEPLSGELRANVVWKLYLAHEYAEAELESRKMTQWYPSFTGGYILASVYLQTARWREAVAELRKSVAESHGSVIELMYLGHALGVSEIGRA